MRKTTLCYLFRSNDSQIMLAMKKRGFGIGKWNGPGGKVENGETIREAASRECKEESGIDVRPEDLEERGIVEFVFEGNTEWDNRCHIFTARSFSGEAQETEEMLPKWWNIADIPYNDMWSDDKIWMPELFKGETIRYRFYFKGDSLLRYEKLNEEVTE